MAVMVRGLLLGTALLIACGDGSADGGASGIGAGGSSGDELERFVDSYCEMARRCCELAGKPPEPLSDCEAEVERQFDLFRAVRAGTVVLLQPALDECFAVLETAADSCEMVLGGADNDCGEMFRGTIGEGGPCEDAIECERDADPVMCLKLRDSANPEPTGVCRQLAKAGAGEPCAMDADERSWGVTYTTQAPGPALAYCARSEGLHCPFPESTCELLPTEGQACDYDCASGLYCDDGDATCKPSLPEGTPCESYSQCADGLGCFGGYCAVPGVADTEICEGDFN